MYADDEEAHVEEEIELTKCQGKSSIETNCPKCEIRNAQNM